MKQPNCCLTLITPTIFEEELVDRFKQRSDVASGLTITRVEGYSQERGPRDDAEIVHGRGPRVRVQALMDRDDATTLLRQLRADLHSPDIAYWVTPVLEFGRLA